MKNKPKKIKRHPVAQAKAVIQAVTKSQAEEKTPPPDIANVQSLRADRKKLENLVTRRKLLGEKIKELEAQAKDLSDNIMPILFRAKVDRVVIAGYPVRVVESGQNRLSKEKLIEEGVDPVLIDKCTVYFPSAPYIRIDKKKDEEEAD